jgi:hypothetical protein
MPSAAVGSLKYPTVQIKTDIPKQLQMDGVRTELLNWLRRLTTYLSLEYGKTVGKTVIKATTSKGGRTSTTKTNWSGEKIVFVKDPPKFDRAGDMVVRVWTTSLKYMWVDLGTKEHVITPKPSNKMHTLAFQKGFTPKTQPRVLASGPGDRRDPWVRRKQVKQHTRPRFFSEEISKLVQAKMQAEVYGVMQAGIDKSIVRYQRGAK